MHNQILNKYYISKYNKFNKIVKKFCNEKNICYNFITFLNYNKNAFASETYKYLHVAPKIFLACSKSFDKYYNSLDIDFATDIIERKELYEYRKQIKKNKELLLFFKQQLKNDFIL